MFVCRNSFVMKVVSLPVCVNVAQVRAVGFFYGCGGGGEMDFWGRIGKALLWRMLWVIFSFCCYSAGCSW
jgi:hypothetical protein